MPSTAEEQIAALSARFLPELHAYMEEAVSTAGALAPFLRYHLGWEEADGSPAQGGGGKALRPVLCLAACEMAGGDWRRAVPIAAAVELVHNFSLAHDDIQDGDTTRRGRATLWSIWGVPAALAAGNAMQAIAGLAAAALRQRGVDGRVARLAVSALTARRLEMIEGQYLDLAFESAERVSVDAYLDMIGQKSGALIGSAMYTGAIAATGDTESASAFAECGSRLGAAFQVRDDYLGVWGEPAATGKPVGADIRRKKKSLPAVYLFDNASEEDRPWLEEAYAAGEIAGDRLERVMALLAKLDGSSYVQRVAEEQAQRAAAAVAGLAIAEESKRQLEAVAEFFVTREK